MKKHIRGILAAALGLSLVSVHAQPGRQMPMGGGGGMRNATQISAAMTKLFGDNQTFSATIENEIQMSQGQTMSLPGKVAFDSGKMRFDMNMSEAKGTAMPPQVAAQMKTMGMDQLVNITRPDLKVSYVIYPGLKAYTEEPDQAGQASQEREPKIETIELDKETVDGHACVKNKTVVTDSEGKQHEFTVWNATDLKNFPIKIETTENGTHIVAHFKNVKLAKPEASRFDPPSDYKKYQNQMDLMREQMMKRMQEGGVGTPPVQPQQ